MDEEITSLTYQVEKLKAELHGHRKARFGSKSESLSQLALDLSDDQEIEAAADAQRSAANKMLAVKAKPNSRAPRDSITAPRCPIIWTGKMSF